MSASAAPPPRCVRNGLLKPVTSLRLRTYANGQVRVDALTDRAHLGEIGFLLNVPAVADMSQVPARAAPESVQPVEPHRPAGPAEVPTATELPLGKTALEYGQPANFVNELLEPAFNSFLSVREIWERYALWCGSVETLPMTHRDLCDALRGSGFRATRIRSSGGEQIRGWRGVRFRAIDPPQLRLVAANG